MRYTANYGWQVPDETDVPDVAADMWSLANDIDGGLYNEIANAYPLGAMAEWPWAASQIPSWALLPYGQLLTNAAYPYLAGIANVSGYPYGGSAGVNFNLPDKRGRVSAGKDDMGGTAANRITTAISGADGKTLGAVFGAEGITLTTAHLPAHAHTASASSSASGFTPYLNTTSSRGLSSSAMQDQLTVGSATITTTVTVNNSTGGGGAHQNSQPSIIVNVFMKVK